jgi:oxalate---CoA ligase
LLDPTVAQAVAFGVPHSMLGEAVGVALVLREGGEPDEERALLEKVGQRLARHKLPRSIYYVDEIPKGPTGKIQRIGMAERLKGQTRRESISAAGPVAR